MRRKYYVIVSKRFDEDNFAYTEYREAGPNMVEGELCEECDAHRSRYEWLPPYELDVSKKKLGDFIFGSPQGFVVSKEFKEKFEETDLKGLSDFREMDLYYDNKLLDIEYYYPRIKLINAFVNLRRLSMSPGKLCSLCQRGKAVVQGIDGLVFLNPDKIEEDIFFTTSIGHIVVVVSERFKEFLDKNNFSNIELLEASEYIWDPFKMLEKKKRWF